MPWRWIDYTELAYRTTAAGCVGYSAQLTGRRVVYFYFGATAMSTSSRYRRQFNGDQTR